MAAELAAPLSPETPQPQEKKEDLSRIERERLSEGQDLRVVRNEA